MGIGPFRGCFTNMIAPAPNPDPSRWSLLRIKNFKYSTVIMVRYTDCTNFEGKKILVFEHNPGFTIDIDKPLDPHFSMNPNAPIARFSPTEKGWEHAVEFAEILTYDLIFEKESYDV